MATLATLFRRPAVIVRSGVDETESRPVSRTRASADPYALRDLPCEDVYFFNKSIDNTRIVREADPKARQDCWMSIGAACVVVAVLTTVAAPGVYSTIAGYKLQSLLQEQQRLLDERKVLEVKEARLLNPAHLEELARGKNLTTPAPGQVVRLDSKSSTALASVFSQR